MSLKFLGDRKNMPIYPWYIADLVSTKDIEELIGCKIRKTMCIFENNTNHLHYDEESANACGKVLLEKILSDHNYFRKVGEELSCLERQLLPFCHNLENTDWESASNEKLIEIMTEYVSRMREMRTWGWVPVFLDGLTGNYLSDKIHSDLERHLKSRGEEMKVSQMYSLLSSSAKASEVQAEEKARLEVLLEIKRRSPESMERMASGEMFESLPEDVRSDIAAHVKKFGWLTYAYHGPVMSSADFMQLAKQNLQSSESLEEALESLKKHYSQLPQLQRQTEEEFQIPDELKYLFEVSRELMYMKDHRKGVYQQSYVLMEPLAREMAKRLRISFDEFCYLIVEEMREALLEGEDMQALMGERMKKCAYIAENGEVRVFQGRELDQILKDPDNAVSVEETGKTGENEIKGMVAYAGVVQGKVKIVLVKEDIPKVEAGDILVSSATNPDLLPAMKMAGAYVTDFGGITSHAAIVSRELRKPCIVGTKNATKILHDGDEVIVDAEKGIVKII